jgi:hypothetical protein
MDSLCESPEIWVTERDHALPTYCVVHDAAPRYLIGTFEDGEIHVADLVDIAIPSNAKSAAESLGLKVHHSVTSGARVRQIPRDEAEIAVECLRDWGFTARILEVSPPNERGGRSAA